MSQKQHGEKVLFYIEYIERLLLRVHPPALAPIRKSGVECHSTIDKQGGSVNIIGII